MVVSAGGTTVYFSILKKNLVQENNQVSEERHTDSMSDVLWINDLFASAKLILALTFV